MHFCECVVDFILTYIFTVCIFVFSFRKVKNIFLIITLFSLFKIFFWRILYSVFWYHPLALLWSTFPRSHQTLCSLCSLCVFPETRSLYERLTAPHTRLTIKYVVWNTLTFGCVLFHWSVASVWGTHLKEEWLSFHQWLSVTSSCLAVWDILSTFSPCGDLVLLDCVAFVYAVTNCRSSVV